MMWLWAVALAGPNVDGVCAWALARGPAVLHTVDAQMVRRVGAVLDYSDADDVAGQTGALLDGRLTSAEGRFVAAVTVEEVPWSELQGCHAHRSGVSLRIGDRTLDVSVVREKNDRPVRRRGQEVFAYLLEEVMGVLPLPTARLAFQVEGEHVVPWSVAQRSDVVTRAVDGLEMRSDDAILGGHEHGALRVHYDVVPGVAHALAADRDLSTELVVLGVPEATARLDDGGTVSVAFGVPEGDPRPAAAHVGVTVDQPSAVTLVVTPELGDRPYRGQEVTVTVVGDGGAAHPRVLYPLGEDGTVTKTVHLAAGDYTVRLQPSRDSRWIRCDDSLPGARPPPPAWCDEPPDPVPWTVRLSRSDAPLASDEALDSAPVPGEPLPGAWSRGIHPVDVPGLPAADEEGVAVPVGDDIVYVPSPADAKVSYRWAATDGSEARGWSPERVGRFSRARFDTLHLALQPGEAFAEATVDVFAFPPPEPVAELEPGYVVNDVTLERLDLRGPLAEITLRVPGPGTWKVGSAWPEGGDPVELEVVAGDIEWGFVPLNVFGAEHYEATWFSTEGAGTLTLRASTCPSCAPQVVDIELQRHE